jgi:hypothetical protein
MAAPRGFEPPDLLPEPSDPSAHPEPNARPRRESLARYSLAPSQRHYAAQVQPPRPRIDEDVLQRLAGLGDIGSQLQASCAHSCHGPMLSAAGLLLSIAADPVSHACVATISLVSGSGSGSLTETAAVATKEKPANARRHEQSQHRNCELGGHVRPRSKGCGGRPVASRRARAPRK